MKASVAGTEIIGIRGIDKMRKCAFYSLVKSCVCSLRTRVSYCRVGLGNILTRFVFFKL